MKLIGIGDMNDPVPHGQTPLYSPNSFANALKMQNQTMHDTYVLPLHHITPAKLFYLQPKIEHITGVIVVVPTRTTSQLGRYNILISSGQFKATKAIITQTFPAWYDTVPADAKQNPESLNFLNQTRKKMTYPVAQFHS
jgi:hypothetical protein